jgi:hypothetical protein
MKLLFNFLTIAFLLIAVTVKGQQYLPIGPIYYNGGNVGIGTPTPQTWFSGKVVEICDDRPILKLTSNNALSTIQFTNKNINTGTRTGEFHLNYQYNSTNDNLSSISFNSYPTQNILNILANGNVGIGNAYPGERFEVNGNIRINDQNSYYGANFRTSDYSIMSFVSRAWQSVQGINGKAFSFRTHNNAGSSEYEAMAIYYGESGKILMCHNGGNVGIGTDNPTQKLSVNGTIRCKEVLVEATPWPDYVFAKGYKLRTLSELEAFIKANNHLPEMPTAADAEQNGVKLSELNTKLLQKVEELTLYLIEQNKKSEAQGKLIEAQNEKIKALTEKIEKLLQK